MAEEKGEGSWKGGEVLFAGATNWATIGRAPPKGKDKEDDESPDLLQPHRLTPLCDVKIQFVASGPAACHCMAVDVNGLCYTWGRNEKGQLGHGDVLDRSMPTVLETLAEMEVVAGSCGKSHTAFVMEDGSSFACGANAMGQCGVGEIKGKSSGSSLEKPVKCLVSDCNKVTCGTDFTVWLCKGKLFAAGCPQYGVLGDGSTHEYNASEGSVKVMFDPEPTPKLIKSLESREITRVAAGGFHVMAVDSDGIPYTWGNGNYGRLGHSVQQHEMKPRPIESFLGRIRLDPNDIIMSAGGMTTFCTIAGGMLYSWGNRKPASSECEMYPRPFIDFQGWKIRDMSCGPGTFAVAAEKSVILWGQGKNGELAKGLKGKRSCANPEKCDFLEGMHTQQVACGHGFTLFLVESDESKLSEFPVFDPTVSQEKEATEDVAEEKKEEEVNRNRTVSTRARNSRKKASRKEEFDDDERPAVKKRKPAAGRKRGRGKKRGQKRR